MITSNKTSTVFACLVLYLSCFISTANSNPIDDVLNKVKSDFGAINAKGEKDRAQIKGEAPPEQQASGGAMATLPEASQSKPTQIIMPKDKRVAKARNEALPTIKKVLAIHQCIQEPDSLRQLNVFAVPGVDIVQNSGYLPAYGFPNSQFFMKFHDRNKCVSLTTMDQWSMPALNALLFRGIYFAEDSGETVNFLYLFKKMDDGSWKIAQLEKGK